MAALIETTDLTTLGLSQEQAATPLAQWLINSASDQVIDAARSPIGPTRSEVEMVQPPGSRIFHLPGLPIRQVHSVRISGELVTDWLATAGGLYRAQGWGNPGPAPVTVDYEHGMEVPSDVKDLVARMVLAGILNAVDGAEGLVLTNGQLSSIALDDFREAYATGQHVEAVTEMDLPQRVRERLAERFGAGGATVRGTW